MIDRPEDLESFTPYLMNRIMARYNKGVEAALLEIGISVAQMRALAVLTESGPCTIGELSVLTVIKQSTLSRKLDTMEATGLIRREAGTHDSRIRQIHLTNAGQSAYDAAWPEMERMRDTMLAALTTKERDALQNILSKVLHDIRHHDF